MSCAKKIASSALLDCVNRPSTGLEVNVALINSDDVDRVLSVRNVDGTIDIELKPNTTGYKIEGIKQIQSYTAEVVKDDASLDKVNHSFSGRIFNITTETRTFINTLINGANLVAVVEKKAKGAAGKFAYQVLGWHNGLEISEGVENSAENDGTFVFTLASNANALEPEMPITFFDTDVATSKTKFDNAFIGPVVP